MSQRTHSRIVVLHVLALAMTITAILPLIARAQGTTTSTLPAAALASSTAPEAFTPPPLHQAQVQERRTFPASLALGERAQARVTNLAANVSTRLEKTVARYDDISTRLAARIAIMKAAGADTQAAEALLSEANTYLGNARISLTTIDAEVQKAVSATDGRGAWEDVRITYLAAASSIRTTHFLLTQSMAALRGNPTPPGAVGSSTTSE